MLIDDSVKLRGLCNETYTNNVFGCVALKRPMRHPKIVGASMESLREGFIVCFSWNGNPLVLSFLSKALLVVLF
jgi:hypothetical protein